MLNLPLKTRIFTDFHKGGFTPFIFLVVSVSSGFQKRMLVEQLLSENRMLVSLGHIFLLF